MSRWRWRHVGSGQELHISRKDALCVTARMQSAPFGAVERAAVGTQECTQISEKCLSATFWGIRVHYCDASSCKVRFLVTLRSQTALFRDTPAAECDGKAHSGCAPSRKGALCDPRATQTALFREGDDPRMRFCVRRRHVCAGEEKRILRKSAVCVREPGMVVPHPVFCRPADTPDTVHRIR